jgi:hypothetical protein
MMVLFVIWLPWTIRDWSYSNTVTSLGKDNNFPYEKLHEKMNYAMAHILAIY